MSGEWRRIANGKQVGSVYVNTYRLAVVGGWIVRTSEQFIGPFSATITSSQVFVPDAGWTWEVEEK